MVSKTVPTAQKEKILIISASKQCDIEVINAANMIKSAIVMANQSNLESDEIFVEIINCFLDIAGRFLFSAEKAWTTLLSIIIDTASKIDVPEGWLVLLNMSDAFSNREVDTSLAVKRFSTAISFARNNQSSATIFYSCLSMILNSNFLEKVYPEFHSEIALNLFVKISRYHLNADRMPLDIFASLQNDCKFFQNSTHDNDMLVKSLDLQSLILKLASIALKCDVPKKTKSLLGDLSRYERNSDVFIQKEYLLAEIAIYKLEKSENPDLSKRSQILSGIAKAIEIGLQANVGAQIINQGCLLIWKSSRAYFPLSKLHNYRELIAAFKVCSEALEELKSSLISVRVQIHFELAKYFYYHDFIPNAATHVKKGLKLCIPNDVIEMELRLLELMIAVKENDHSLADSINLRGKHFKINLYSGQKHLSCLPS